MNWFLSHNFDQKRGFLTRRAEIIRVIRRYFGEQGFDEVDTPVLQVCPTFDTHIHGIPAGKGLYLRTSPEFDMKKLMVAGMEKIYQIGPVFRDEPQTRLHNPEFTMLEWYRVGKDYRALIEDCRTLLRLCSDHYEYDGKSCDSNLNLNIKSIAELFDIYLEIDLTNYLEDAQKFAALLNEKGIRTTENDNWQDLFHAAMAEKIEPHLGVGAPTIVYDYPICMASLARPKPDDPRFAERMELYVCGVELANGFSELTDPAIQKQRFEQDIKEKERLYGVSYPPDEEFFKALKIGLPQSAGIALGLDRLIVLATGAADVHAVRFVPSQQRD